MVEFKLRLAVARDIPRLLEIQSLCPEAARWTEPDYQDAISGDASLECLVAARQGEIAGLMVCRFPAAGEAEILNLAVHRAHRRQGVGGALIRALLGRNPHKVWLEVRASNQAARAFYRQLGFVETGRRKQFYRDPAEDAVLMRRDASVRARAT